ncbi:Sec-independent protein translocase protein TatB [Gellertiella hungarica]|uniref:Sec-independent protein translocase protein TatB n=1 Tax=Gellertiella hungarica TaxID=1572859 RepID=A0A7W6J6P1_9HYPH|nr:Sec-independent protein translocase protein TatB [Gellertiella hungarica]MBB4064982.1 sec-independent protein translocase protein TatB [Gellertiella hungarica]
MLDVGWSELLVIAVVLIVVVGPKDLPPMLRAFGRMSRKFSSMAGEFRKQFDDALNEADMGDLRQTITDVQRLHPVNTIREAMTPLRQAAEDIRSDIKKTVEANPASAAAPSADASAVTIPAPPVALDAAPPAVVPEPGKTVVPGEAAPVVSTAALAASLPVAPVAEVVTPKPRAKRSAKAEVSADAPKPASRKKAAPAAEVAMPAEKPRKKTTATKKDKA